MLIVKIYFGYFAVRGTTPMTWVIVVWREKRAVVSVGISYARRQLQPSAEARFAGVGEVRLRGACTSGRP